MERFAPAVIPPAIVMKQRLHHLCIGLLLAVLVSHVSAQIYPPPWNTGAVGTTWEWDESAASPFGSLRRYGSAYDVRILLQKQKDGSRLSISFLDGEREVFTIHGHDRTVFATWGDRLYYGLFNTASNGAEIVAVDLKTGEELWKSPVFGIGMVSHSSYSNALILKADPHAVTIYGNEAGGQYFETEDTNTGVTTTHKIFSRDETDPAAIGARNAVEEYYGACQRGYLDGVKRYLAAGVDVNALYKGNIDRKWTTTPLHLAVEKVAPNVVAHLLDHGHAMTRKDADQKTLFDLAVESAVKASTAAPSDAKPPVLYETGLTALQGALKCSLLLLQHGAPTTPAALDTLRPIAQAAGDADLLRAIDKASSPKPVAPAPLR
jgi:outer membrane protein assembly factor BamB